MHNIKAILQQAVSNDGIDVAVLVGRDGFVIEAAASNSAKDTEAIGAMVSTGMGSAESVGSQLGLSSLKQAMMEYSGGVIVMSNSGRDAILAVEAGNQSNLGAVRLIVKKTAEELIKAM